MDAVQWTREVTPKEGVADVAAEGVVMAPGLGVAPEEEDPGVCAAVGVELVHEASASNVSRAAPVARTR